MKRYLFVLLLMIAPAAFAQSAEDLFQQATQKERVDGDLQGAIALLERVVDTATDRSLAAQALLRIGENYERLGRDNAAEAYQRIVDQFSDQNEEANAARRKLVTLAGSSGDEALSASNADIPFNTKIYAWGSAMSPDGSSIVGIDIESGLPGIYDLQSGNWEVLKSPSQGEAWGEYARVSHANRYVAYGTYPKYQAVMELRLYDTKLKTDSVLLDVNQAFGDRFDVDITSSSVYPMDWYSTDDAVLVFAWIGGTSRTDSSKFTSNLFLRIPLSGSESEILFEDVNSSFGWQSACLLNEDRSFVVDWMRERRRELLLVTPDQNTEPIFKSHEGVDYQLFSCIDGGTDFAFSGSTLSSVHLYKGDIATFSQRPDAEDHLLQLKEGDWGVIGSEAGDLAVLDRLREPANLYLLERNSKDAFVEKRILKTDSFNDRYLRGIWHPSKALHYSLELEQFDTYLIERDIESNLERRLGRLPGANLNNQLFFDGTNTDIWLLARRPADGAVWYRYDLAKQAVVDSSLAQGDGFQMMVSHTDGTFYQRNPDRDNCFDAVDGKSGKRSIWTCIEKVERVGLSLWSSADSAYVTWISQANKSTGLFLLDADGNVLREVVNWPANDELTGFFAWGEAGNVYYARFLQPSNAPRKFLSIEKINVWTSEVTTVLDEEIEHLHVRRFDISSDGRFIALHASALPDEYGAGVILKGIASQRP